MPCVARYIKGERAPDGDKKQELGLKKKGKGSRVGGGRKFTKAREPLGKTKNPSGRKTQGLEGKIKDITSKVGKLHAKARGALEVSILSNPI